jgi:hypothetical protein
MKVTITKEDTFEFIKGYAGYPLTVTECVKVPPSVLTPTLSDVYCIFADAPFTLDTVKPGHHEMLIFWKVDGSSYSVPGVPNTIYFRNVMPYIKLPTLAGLIQELRLAKDPVYETTP